MPLGEEVTNMGGEQSTSPRMHIQKSIKAYLTNVCEVERIPLSAM